jgi:hypothetical protein
MVSVRCVAFIVCQELNVSMRGGEGELGLYCVILCGAVLP